MTSWPAVLTIDPIHRASGAVHLPGSKSISNRVLLLAALANGETLIDGSLEADDTRVMREAMVQAISEADPTLTDEMAAYAFKRTMMQMVGMMTPQAFFWYHHCGYREIWNRPDYNDPQMRRSFDAYFHEALEKGWFAGIADAAEADGREHR